MPEARIAPPFRAEHIGSLPRPERLIRVPGNDPPRTEPPCAGPVARARGGSGTAGTDRLASGNLQPIGE